MATTRWASKSAPTFLQISGFRRGFSSAPRPTFGPPASTTIDEKKIKDEMRLLFPEHLKQKRLEKTYCVMKTFKHPLQNGQWLFGWNAFNFGRKEDQDNEDKGTLVAGYRFVVDPEKGKFDIGSFECEFEED